MASACPGARMLRSGSSRSVSAGRSGPPHHLYYAGLGGLGGLVGRRFLRLTHTGRRSGREFHTVLEVVEYDPVSGAVTLVSGFGRGADWFRNVAAGGPVGVDLGRGPRLAC